ncbi:MAG TPA: porphobilinogen synthase [Legionellales bacterium]|nr:porphobilinogen synthase [Legionellales bacterium]|tara:strand:- start:603 stop:1583 length:981 start_codon:yes stop_codon:yes gene_type:complete
MTYLPLRLTRLRQTPITRALVQETHLHRSQLITPLFIHQTLKAPRPIASMPGQMQWPLKDLPKVAKNLANLGLNAVLLFGIPDSKDACGSTSWDDDGVIQQAIRAIKDSCPEMLVISDVCFCEYTSHGHCGVLDGTRIDNDATLLNLQKQAISHAKAGADWLAPSGMVDGMVGSLRQALDKAGFIHTAILSYAVKYSSSLYNPFREAAEGAPQFGDRKSYQMNPANVLEALREAELDVAEGADMLMVKPAMHYLDVIYRVKQRFACLPLCAYQVSGEYAMLKFAAQQGLIDEDSAVMESLTAIKRAGADMIISYFSQAIAEKNLIP